MKELKQNKEIFKEKQYEEFFKGTAKAYYGKKNELKY
jgi:hypothetical protein